MTDPRQPRTACWSPLQRVAFRFTFAWLLFYYPVLVVNRLPGFGWLIDAWNAGWASIAPWFARNVFRAATSFPDTSEGLIDVTYSYARLACVLLFALLSTVVWSVVDRKRRDYRRLNEGMRVVLRYGLANAMLFYGLAKVLPHQFGSASLERLLEPLGAMTRMGLLWTFMGQSVPYTVFCGAAECIGGILLLFRRTTTLGAWVIIGVMANVVALDFSYGVFVKLFAAHLMAMALLIAAPDLALVWRVFVLHRPTVGRSFVPHFATPRALRLERTVKALFVTYLVGSVLWIQLDAFHTSREQLPAPRLYGIWEVDSFTRDGVEAPPLTTDGARWRRLVLDRSGKDVLTSDATLWTMADARDQLEASEDAAHHTVTFSGKGARLVFDYLRPDLDHLTLRGPVDGVELVITFHRVDETTLRLPSEVFHWTNDRPFHAM